MFFLAKDDTIFHKNMLKIFIDLGWYLPSINLTEFPPGCYVMVPCALLHIAEKEEETD